jgi:hypothetical protein
MTLQTTAIKFHDIADNSQKGMKHQMRGGTQAQQGMTSLLDLRKTIQRPK